MVIRGLGYSLSVVQQRARPGMPGLLPKSVTPSGRPILLCVLAAGAVKQPRCFGSRGGRLFATRRLGRPPLQNYSSSRLWSRLLPQKQLARCAYWARPWNESVFDIAIIGSTWLRLDREERRRRGWDYSLVFVPGMWSGLSRCPERGQGPMCLTDQTAEAGDLVPRCNMVGRTLGGRDKDKMTDCPMVLALDLEGKIRDLADTRCHTTTLRKQTPVQPCTRKTGGD